MVLSINQDKLVAYPGFCQVPNSYLTKTQLGCLQPMLVFVLQDIQTYTGNNHWQQTPYTGLCKVGLVKILAKRSKSTQHTLKQITWTRCLT